jgi:alcohol dehydrogenase
MLNYDHFFNQPRTRVIFEQGAADRAGTIARDLGATRALLVTDPGIVKAGHADRVRTSLQSAGVDVTMFDAVHENPTTDDVDAAAVVARDTKPDILIGLGGGSAMDTAKGCNFIHTNGGSMHDYWGVGKAACDMLPLVAIPTTAGTGSECQSFALIADAKTHRKMACGDPKAAARFAILDPTLTMTQPRAVTVHAGIDAVAHAVETAVTTKRTQQSLAFAHEAFRLTSDNLPRVLADPGDIEARGRMLLGAAIAGSAIEQSMLGAAHACANPLTAQFDIVHGQAVGMMLPHVVRYNGENPAVAELYQPLGGVDGLIDRLNSLLTLAALPRTLGELNIPADAIAALAADAATQWTGTFNPRPVGEPDFIHLYESALK